jgi:hypothetical protein
MASPCVQSECERRICFCGATSQAVGDPAAVSHLIRVLADPAPDVSDMAASSLGTIGRDRHDIAVWDGDIVRYAGLAISTAKGEG